MFGCLNYPCVPHRASRWTSSVGLQPEPGSGRRKLVSAKVRPLTGTPAGPDSRGPYDGTLTVNEVSCPVSQLASRTLQFPPLPGSEQATLRE